MGGKKRSKHQSSKPFLEDDDGFSKKRPKTLKKHQKEEQFISPSVSTRIVKEALAQQKEIQDEADKQNPNSLVFTEEPKETADSDEDDMENLDSLSDHDIDTNEIDMNDELLLDSFLSKHGAPQRTLAVVIADKLREKDAQVSSEIQEAPKLNDTIIELYKGVGKLLSRYTVGKMPKALKHIPSIQFWEEILYLTEPENWSPNAMYQVTRIFASNLNEHRVARFYEFVLLPRVREDIRKNKRLHFALYQSLKKAVYKPSAFYKGVILPLNESGTCTLREAVIIGSIIQKISIPYPPSSAALCKLASMEYCGTTSYFIKLILEKKYSLPLPVVNKVLSHFMEFYDDERTMPSIWHQSLLTFVLRYKNALSAEDKDDLRNLLKRQRHYYFTPEVHRELDSSEKGDDDSSRNPSQMVINKAIEEDRFDVPDVPMEED